MDIGLVQGRLSPPIRGFQECPKDWKREFVLLRQIGLTHIEWVVTAKSFSDNPIFFGNHRKKPINSICADNVVSTLITDEGFLNHNLSPICSASRKNNINFVTIPLLEDSSVEEDEKLDKFCFVFKKICKKYPDINFSLETEISLSKIPKLLNISENIFLTYDTGNTTSYNLSHEKYINSFYERISNVHIKDRTLQGETVAPLTGDTNFIKIFSLLKSKKYFGPFTLQTARGKPSKEFETIQKHFKTMRNLYEQC